MKAAAALLGFLTGLTLQWLGLLLDTKQAADSRRLDHSGLAWQGLAAWSDLLCPVGCIADTLRRMPALVGLSCTYHCHCSVACGLVPVGID